jgi:uncharacterized protein
MQLQGGRLVYSASDLNNYLECGHLVALERNVALGALLRPERRATAELIAKKGLEHEQRYLDRLRIEHAEVVEIQQAENTLEGIERAASATIDAMRRGAPVIYQGTFFDGTFLGKSDFLLRVEKPSATWPWSYEVADTKLALHDKPYFVIQLCHYSEHVARVQGTSPEYMEVVLGNGERRRLRVDDYAAYYRHLKGSFLRDGAAADAYPLKCNHCAICDWSPRCERQREDDDHLSLVAWMRRDNIRKLEEAGIGRVGALAAANANRPAGMQEKTYERLRRQAALQVRGRESGGYHYELIPHHPSEGFAMLPAPAEGDVFFDMEGDPFFEVGVGLEYLFGCYSADTQSYCAFWGTDRADEKLAFERCVDFFTERRRAFPKMHIYHYAQYEKTALRKLAQRHGTREDEVDELLRGEVLVDLFAIVRQTLMISQSSYSIKKLEPFYGLERTADVRSGDDSVVMFENWMSAPERGEILRDIEQYNEEDCRSTWMLREWLLERREEAQAQYSVVFEFRPVRQADEPCHAPPLEGCKKCERRVREERERAKISETARALLQRDNDVAAVLLGHLLSYHRREEKPAWWALFDRYENPDHLLEFDREAMAGLELRRDIEPYKNPGDTNRVYAYSFPEQQHRLDEGDRPLDPHTRKPAGQIVKIDENGNLIHVKRGGSPEEAQLLTAMVPGGPIVADPQKQSLGRVGAAYLDGTLAQHPATLDILRRIIPRLVDRRAGARIQPENVSEDTLFEIVGALDRSYLFVQGPPGTGKTHIGARVISKLINSGKRVGVMANSHKAIHNLLHAIEAAAHGDSNSKLRGFHKHSKQNADSPYRSKVERSAIASEDDNDAAEHGDYTLISGNAWLFAREGMVDRLDYLFVDEAGQVSLADAVAVSRSASNVVLLGDPMQLAQVSQGMHAEEARSSVLEHLLGEASTVREDRGVLLDVSYRMQPEICDFISRSVYDGRLKADPATAKSRIDSPGLSGGGLRYIPVDHSGNGADCFEEAERIVREVGLLLRGTVIRKDEPERKLVADDILIVTPYNAQRKRLEGLLRSAGFDAVRVGTVDKFQGQQAPVVFYSMATSSGEDLPRNMEFLFEKNRFNVAISRAQCMSVLVCSPRLLDMRCNHVEQVARVNLLCRYVEQVT